MRYDHSNFMEAIDFFLTTSPTGYQAIPIISAILEYGENTKSTYLVMELADSDLENYIKADITENTRIRLCYELASAISYLNETEFYHCDIKPANCLMMDNVLKLADYGLVKYRKIQSEQCQSSLCAPPEILGNRFGINSSGRKRAQRQAREEKVK